MSHDKITELDELLNKLSDTNDRIEKELKGLLSDLKEVKQRKLSSNKNKRWNVMACTVKEFYINGAVGCCYLQ